MFDTLRDVDVMQREGRDMRMCLSLDAMPMRDDACNHLSSRQTGLDCGNKSCAKFGPGENHNFPFSLRTVVP